MKTEPHKEQKAESRRQKWEGEPAALRTLLGFTLIELLVVVSIIGLLAALTFPAVTHARIAMLRARAKSELTALETVIERYNQKLGVYPPDNAPYWEAPPLYYELLGTTNVNGVFHTLDDSAQLTATLMPGAFNNPALTGFLNCSRGGGDGLVGAVRFVGELKAGQFMSVTNFNVTTPITVLGTSLDGPMVYQSATGAKLNPWRYNSSSPQHNPKSFDLWIDVAAGDKTNRICNWSDRYIVVSTPNP